jgi:hypothetical protein
MLDSVVLTFVNVKIAKIINNNNEDILKQIQRKTIVMYIVTSIESNDPFIISN